MLPVQPRNCDEPTAEDIAVIEKVLQQIDRQIVKTQLVEQIVYWKLGLKLFKDLEVQYLCMADRSSVEKKHRTLLTILLAITEVVTEESQIFSDQDLASIALSRQAIEANLKYVRRKHEQWYGRMDQAVVSETRAAIANARSSN